MVEMLVLLRIFVTHLTLLLSVSNKPIKDNRLTPVRSYPAVNYLTHSWGFFLKITGKIIPPIKEYIKTLFNNVIYLCSSINWN